MRVCACTHTQPRPWLVVCWFACCALNNYSERGMKKPLLLLHAYAHARNTTTFASVSIKLEKMHNFYKYVCVCLLVLPSNTMRVSIVYILNISLIISVYLSLSLRTRLLRSKKCVFCCTIHTSIRRFFERRSCMCVFVCFVFFNVLITI